MPRPRTPRRIGQSGRGVTGRMRAESIRCEETSPGDFPYQRTMGGGFPIELGALNQLHAAFLKVVHRRCRPAGYETGHFLSSAESATNPGAPSFALFAKGGIPRISIPTVAYPTLCQERKGWGTRLFVVLPAVPNTNRGLIENFETHI